MASTYTTNLRLTKQGDGDNPNSWGQVLNDGVISLADEAIAGYTTVSIGSAATVNLTANDGADDQARSAFLEIKGSIGTVATSIFLVVPSNTKSYSILNKVSANADSNVVMMRVAGNTGVTLGRSSTTFQHVVCDGTSLRSANLLPNNVCIADNLFVGNNAQIAGTVTVAGAGTFKAAVSVEGAAKFASTVTVSGAANFKSTVTVEGAQVNKSTILLEGAVSLNDAPVHQTITTIADAASIVMNMATNNQFLVTLGGNRTLAAPTNLTVGQTGHIYCIQNSGGGHTLGYNSVFQFAGGSDPVATPAGGAVNLLVFSVRATDKVDAVMVNDLK
tara:strand:+ start:804 stop:1799 length:996 start_codon:yes stop_codon:yes gene_type:complete